MSQFQQVVDVIVKKELDNLKRILVNVKPQTTVDNIIKHTTQEKK